MGTGLGARISRPMTLGCRLPLRGVTRGATRTHSTLEDPMKANPPPPKASLGFGITGKAEEYGYRADDESSAIRKAKILVVDPDPALRRLMATRLGAANYA